MAVLASIFNLLGTYRVERGYGIAPIGIRLDHHSHQHAAPNGGHPQDQLNFSRIFEVIAHVMRGGYDRPDVRDAFGEIIWVPTERMRLRRCREDDVARLKVQA